MYIINILVTQTIIVISCFIFQVHIDYANNLSQNKLILHLSSQSSTEKFLYISSFSQITVHMSVFVSGLRKIPLDVEFNSASHRPVHNRRTCLYHFIGVGFLVRVVKNEGSARIHNAQCTEELFFSDISSV